jgi:hypothetical protein
VLGDTWAWTGDGWEELSTGVDAPEGRRAHAMAYDPQRGRAVAFGGRDTLDTLLQDTWVLEATE